MSSYYETLWVTKSANQDEIKKAYRKQAMQWHPDKHKWDEKAEAKFKEINEAYQTLSDTQKKQQYDTFGKSPSGTWPAWASGFSGGWAGFWGFDDMFRWAASGASWWQQVEFDLNDLFWAFAWGAGWSMGGGMWWSSGWTNSANSKKNDLEQTIKLSVWDLIIGTKVRLKWPDGKIFKLTIPEATKPGTKFKVSGKWKSSLFWSKGDLFIKVQPTMPRVTDEMRKSIEGWR